MTQPNADTLIEKISNDRLNFIRGFTRNLRSIFADFEEVIKSIIFIDYSTVIIYLNLKIEYKIAIDFDIKGKYNEEFKCFVSTKSFSLNKFEYGDKKIKILELYYKICFDISSKGILYNYIKNNFQMLVQKHPKIIRDIIKLKQKYVIEKVNSYTCKNDPLINFESPKLKVIKVVETQITEYNRVGRDNKRQIENYTYFELETNDDYRGSRIKLKEILGKLKSFDYESFYYYGPAHKFRVEYHKETDLKLSKAALDSKLEEASDNKYYKYLLSKEELYLIIWMLNYNLDKILNSIEQYDTILFPFKRSFYINILLYLVYILDLISNNSDKFVIKHYSNSIPFAKKPLDIYEFKSKIDWLFRRYSLDEDDLSFLDKNLENYIIKYCNNKNKTSFDSKYIHSNFLNAVDLNFMFKKDYALRKKESN